MSNVEALRLRPIQAELMFVAPRGNVRVAPGLYVRIHADSHGRRGATSLDLTRRFFHEHFKFGLGFDIKEQDSSASTATCNSIVQGFANLVPLFAHTGEYYSVASHADALQVIEFSAGNNVKAAP